MEATLKAVAAIFKSAAHTVSKDTFGNPRFESGAWEQITNQLSRVTFPNVQTLDSVLFSDENLSTTLSDINDKYEGYILENLYCMRFSSLYPHVISDLIENGKFSSKPPFREFHFIVRNRALLSRQFSGDAESYRAMKLWINYFYGKLTTFSEDKALVIDTVSRLLYSQANRFKWVYYDTDEIFFFPTLALEQGIFKRGYSEMRQIIGDVGYPYEIDHVRKAIFFDKKKYVAEIDISPDSSPIYHLEIHGFKNMPHISF